MPGLQPNIQPNIPPMPDLQPGARQDEIRGSSKTAPGFQQEGLDLPEDTGEDAAMNLESMGKSTSETVTGMRDYSNVIEAAMQSADEKGLNEKGGHMHLLLSQIGKLVDPKKAYENFAKTQKDRAAEQQIQLDLESFGKAVAGAVTDQMIYLSEKYGKEKVLSLLRDAEVKINSKQDLNPGQKQGFLDRIAQTRQTVFNILKAQSDTEKAKAKSRPNIPTARKTTIQ